MHKGDVEKKQKQLYLKLKAGKEHEEKLVTSTNSMNESWKYLWDLLQCLSLNSKPSKASFQEKNKSKMQKHFFFFPGEILLRMLLGSYFFFFRERQDFLDVIKR